MGEVDGQGGTQSDIKTILGKNKGDDLFNLLKNEAAKDVRGFLQKSTYEGWAETQPGKHPETAYFVYYSKKTKRKLVMCVRKMKKTGVYKPYAIVSPQILKSQKVEIKKGKPL